MTNTAVPLVGKNRCLPSGPSVVTRVSLLLVHTSVNPLVLNDVGPALSSCGCKLRPGTLASEINKRDVETYLPSIVQYACYYWVEHLQKSKIKLHDHGKVHLFLQKRLLHWLEGMGLMKNTSEAILALSVLLSHIPVSKKSVAAIELDVLTGKG
jgi:hypothetical protein